MIRFKWWKEKGECCWNALFYHVVTEHLSFNSTVQPHPSGTACRCHPGSEDRVVHSHEWRRLPLPISKWHANDFGSQCVAGKIRKAAIQIKDCAYILPLWLWGLVLIGRLLELFVNYSSVFGDKSTSEGIGILHLEMCLLHFKRWPSS